MDRNTLTGFILIALILIGYTYFTSPSEEEKERMRQKRDSIAQVEKQKQAEAEALLAQEADSAKKVEAKIKETNSQNDSLLASDQTSDSAKTQMLQDQFGVFADAAKGEDKEIVIENEVMKVFLSAKGGRPVRVQLKEYDTYSGEPLYLFDEDSSQFNFNFFYRNRLLNTEDFYFEPTSSSFSISGEEQQTVSMRLYAGSDDRYLELKYGLTGDSYLMDFTVNVIGLDDLLRQNNNELAFNWNLKSLDKEKGREPQYMATTVFFKYLNDDVDYLSESSDEETQALEASTKWISLKQHFFSVIAIADDHFDKINGQVKAEKLENSKKYTKYLGATITLTYDDPGQTSFPMKFYYGPNHYETLKDIGYDLEQQIDLGWGIFGWVNEFLIIKVFNFLDRFNLGYGLIILILTIFIKMLLFPLTYKNYLSSAKQRVLKPEVDELNEKYKDKDPMKKQQALMGLYRQAGVNPMAGCVPMVLQFPILFAMYRFFPASIELRQESFLWADDLSSYDSIYELPFEIPFYGDHVSLFTLLMATSTMLYTRFNTQATAMSGPQASQMKIMMYIMPVFFLGFFNNFAAGLTYYYFMANVTSMLQQWVIKKFFINEEAIHKKIQQNKKNPKKAKKSKFQKRLEDMAKQRGYNPPKK